MFFSFFFLGFQLLSNEIFRNAPKTLDKTLCQSNLKCSWRPAVSSCAATAYQSVLLNRSHTLGMQNMSRGKNKTKLATTVRFRRSGAWTLRCKTFHNPVCIYVPSEAIVSDLLIFCLSRWMMAPCVSAVPRPDVQGSATASTQGRRYDMQE